VLFPDVWKWKEHWVKAVASGAAAQLACLLMPHELPSLGKFHSWVFLLLNHLIALFNCSNAGWQRVRTVIGNEWHFSELKGEEWVGGVSCGADRDMCILECIKI